MDFHALAYILLNLICCAFILYLGFDLLKNEMQSVKRQKGLRLVLDLIILQLFIYLVSESGFTISLEFPPKFAIVFIIPSFIFSAIFLYSNRNSNWIKKVSLKQITLFQSFRILVESLFLWSVAKGILHYNVSIEGYNFDMIFGFTALLVYLIIWVLKKENKKLLLYWNYLGVIVLASVIFVFVSTLYLPQIYGFDKTPMKVSFLEYPFVLVAAFMMPLAVFLHILSIIRINKNPKIN